MNWLLLVLEIGAAAAVVWFFFNLYYWSVYGDIIKDRFKRLLKPSANTVYYVIINEIVASTSDEDILKKLTTRYRLEEANARLLIELAKLGQKEWFEETYLTKDGIYVQQP